MAKAVLDNEQLGQDDVTDMLAISISSTDIIGHAYGTRGAENKAAYMRTDAVNLSKEAIRACREAIEKYFGASYLPKTAKEYKNKTKSPTSLLS